MSLLEFWEFTPYEFFQVVEAYNQRYEEEAEEKICLAYMTAALVRCKKMPTLKRVLEDAKKKQFKKSEPMSDKAMLNTVKALNAALGGTIY